MTGPSRLPLRAACRPALTALTTPPTSGFDLARHRTALSAHQHTANRLLFEETTLDTTRFFRHADSGCRRMVADLPSPVRYRRPLRCPRTPALCAAARPGSLDRKSV